MIAFDFRTPTTLEETFSLLEEYGEDGRLISGGTALLLLVRQLLVRPTCLIHLGRIAELRGITRDQHNLKIGALTTHREAETSPALIEAFPALAETFSHVATVRIRNMATLGGNLAHADPSLDPPVTLMALDARVHLSGREGHRIIPLDAFFSDYFETVAKPGEVLSHIEIPLSVPGTATTFLKFLPRSADDYATVAVAVHLVPDDSAKICRDVRIVLGSAGATTFRARSAEDAMRGQPLTSSTFEQAGALARSEADPISDIRGSAEYKKDMAAVFVRRALNKACEQLRRWTAC
jgi:carbon-monoxide dehydrogenase medium subunit